MSEPAPADPMRPWRQPALKDIIMVTAWFFQMEPRLLREKTNRHTSVVPRQIAMGLCRELTTRSLSQIGHAFGGKHHTTVLHSIARSRQLLEDPAYRNAYEQIRQGVMSLEGRTASPPAAPTPPLVRRHSIQARLQRIELLLGQILSRVSPPVQPS